MKIIRAQAMGMCFGVRRALEIAAAVDRPADVTLHGPLVHNEQVNKGLRQRGFRLTDDPGRSATVETPIVMITAHGASQRQRARFLAAGKRIIDATCPLVHRIHQAAQDLQAAGRWIILIGKPGHTEVQGVVEDLQQVSVVEKPDDVERYCATRLGVLCQSTTPPDVAREVLSEIHARNPGSDIQYLCTICTPTQHRQEAALALLRRVDALVVVGGKHSNNTRQLARLAEQRSVPCFQVQTADAVDAYQLFSFDSIGLSAGTSTLETVVEEVHRKLLSICEAKNAFALHRIASSRRQETRPSPLLALKIDLDKSRRDRLG